MPAPLPPRTLGTSREELVRRQEEALAKIERSVERKVEVEMSRGERSSVLEAQDTAAPHPESLLGVVKREMYNLKDHGSLEDLPPEPQEAIQEAIQEVPGSTIGDLGAVPVPEPVLEVVEVAEKRKVGRPKGSGKGGGDRSEQKHLFVRDFPFEVKQRAKAMALLSGVSFRVFVTAALMEHSRRVKEGLDNKEGGV